MTDPMKLTDVVIEHCMTCRFYKLAGECRRCPPRMHFTGTRLLRVWPLPKPDDWCGEYKPKDKSDD